MRSLIRLVTVAAVAIIPVVGLLAETATSKPKPRPASAQLIVTASPNPAIETSTSNISIVVQVEALPQYSNSQVTISSTQNTAHCRFARYETLLGGSPGAPTLGSSGSITVQLDNDGNATVVATARSCAPGSVLMEASLNAPPFATATTKLIFTPPQVTPPGLAGFPAGEVETGDGGVNQGPFGASDVYAVFYVETHSVFAEQTVTIGANELEARCGLGFRWEAGPAFISAGPHTNGVTFSTTIDNNGNAAFLFMGASCAAGRSTVIAEVAANGATYSAQYNIRPPSVTI